MGQLQLTTPTVSSHLTLSTQVEPSQKAPSLSLPITTCTFSISPGGISEAVPPISASWPTESGMSSMDIKGAVVSIVKEWPPKAIMFPAAYIAINSTECAPSQSSAVVKAISSPSSSKAPSAPPAATQSPPSILYCTTATGVLASEAIPLKLGLLSLTGSLPRGARRTPGAVVSTMKQD